MRKTSCHRRREEKFPPQRRRGAENAENAEEYANSHCLCDLCVLCASAVKAFWTSSPGSKPTYGTRASRGVAGGATRRGEGWQTRGPTREGFAMMPAKLPPTLTTTAWDKQE